MGNPVSKKFEVNGTWTAPAGVKKARLQIVIDEPTKLNNCQADIFGSRSMAVRTNGTVMAWGQVSNFGLEQYSSPMLFGGLGWLARMVSGENFHFVLTVNGDLYSMGDNAFGQLGVSSVSIVSSPSIVLGGKTWREVASSFKNAYGIDENGDLWGWGNNSQGQLGNGSVTHRSTPFLVTGGIKAKKVVTAIGSCAFLDFDGNAYMMGWTPYGTFSTPTIIPGNVKFKDIALGNSWNDPLVNDLWFVGITTDGDLMSMGQNTHGQLGNGTTTSSSVLVAVSGGLKAAVVKCGYAHVAAITVAGDMYCWGNNVGGNIGNNTVTSVSTPTLVLGSRKYTDLLIGVAVTGGITNDGDLYMWGLNTAGSLGTGNVTSRSTPFLVVGSYKWGAIFKKPSVFDETLDVTPGATYDVVVAGPSITFGNATEGTQVLYRPAGARPIVNLSYLA